MTRVVLIAFSFCLIQLPAQEYFFEFIPGWKAYYAEESMNGYYVLGSNYDDVFENHVQTTDLDFLGSILSESEFDYPEDSIKNLQFTRFNSFLSEEQKNFSVGSIRVTATQEFKGILVKWNSDYTDTLMTSAIQLDSATELRTIQKVGINQLLISAYVQANNFDLYTSLLETDTLGNIQWQQDFYCDNLPASICRLQPIHTLQCPDGGYLLTCRQVRTNNSCNFPVSSTLIKTDAQGNEQWRIRPGPHETFYVEPGWPVLLDNGNIMFFWTDPRYDPPPTDGCWQVNDSATVRLAEIDLSDGAILTEGDFSDILPNVYNGLDYQRYYLSQAQMISDGDIILSGSNLRDAFIAKVSQAGELIWFRTHVPQAVLDEGLDLNAVDTYIHGLIETSDGGFLGVGEFQVNPFFSETWPDGFQTAFALKLDEYGCLEPGCEVVGIPDWEIQDSRLEIFPNPVSGNEINIRFPQEVGVESMVMVDAWGSEVCLRLESLRFEVSAHSETNFKLQTKELQTLSGLYTLIITTREGSVYSGKVMIE